MDGCNSSWIGCTVRSEDRFHHDDVSRGLSGYCKELGPDFRRDVARWSRDLRILDGGAGVCKFAEDLIRLKRGGAPSVVGIVENWSEHLSIGRALRMWPRAECRVLQIGTRSAWPNVRRLGVGTFDRIVDCYGAFAYSRRIDIVLAQYLALLRVGGVAWITVALKELYDVDPAPSGWNSAVDGIHDNLIRAPQLTFADWLDPPTNGFGLRERDDPIKSLHVLEIEKRASQCHVPELHVIRHTPGWPSLTRYALRPRA